ncbi:hypothetical protein QCA50_007881 [Cerrena zonata]|uniref:JmjC domain-containing histone demethylation protein 1 n=1 Tax=Cerrena zonata TaxID=2478898 RepID=A0AAW0G6W7_9APHY
MARAKRRGGRANAGSQESQEHADASAASAGSPAPTENGAQGHPSSSHQDDDSCPACSQNEKQEDKEAEPESWVRCDACRVWFHWRCAGKGELEAIDKWYCRPCLDADSKRVITMKPPARKSSRKKTQRDYAGLHAGNESDPGRWLRMLEGKDIKPHSFKRMKGSEVTLEWLESDPTAMTEPVLIESPDGLGMKMPSEDFSVSEVAEIVGEDTPVEVIDVATQSNVPGWTLQKWAEYFETEPAKRDKIRNVISLEISGTSLADKILPPRLVRDVDWVEKFWPSTKRGRGHTYPKVQLYCLMGVQDAWTDWHIDFAGSSVYYHILHGEKVFYFIRPTPSNLAAYERWSGTEMQNHSWLGDMCDDVYKVELKTGNTMMIPTGWIHAVYTPKDTLVFGGNFLHSYNVATQLKVREIEIATHVPKKFRFPFFSKLCWYAGEKYLRDLKAKEEFPSRVLDSVETLADFLVSEARAIERGTEQAKKEAKDQVPSERVKDPGAMARELRWRVKFASGYTSDDETSHHKRKGKGTASSSVASLGEKRKRGVEDDEELRPFRNFKPRLWDKVKEVPVKDETRSLKRKRVVDLDPWVGGEDLEEEEEGEEATIRRRTNVVVKVRKTAKGLERQRLERVTEEWVWGDEMKPPLVSSSIPVDATASLPATVNGANGSHEEGARKEEDETPPVPMETETAA